MIIKIIALTHDPTDRVAFFSIQMCNILHILLKLLNLLTRTKLNSIQFRDQFLPIFPGDRSKNARCSFPLVVIFLKTRPANGDRLLKMRHPSTKTVTRLPHSKLPSKKNASFKPPATDRRSGKDRRKSYDPNYFLNGGIERRSWQERRFLWYMTE